MKPSLLLVAAGTAGVLAACSSGSTPSSSSSITAIPTTHRHHPRPPVTVTVTSSPSTSASTTSASPPAGGTTGPCATGQLQLTLGQGQGSAGSFDTPVILTNTGGASCSLTGYPGVSYVSGSGAQIGPSAAEATSPATRTVVLPPGSAASADLHQPDPGDYSSGCAPRQAQRLRVYPPNQRSPLTVTDRVTVCYGTQGRSTITVMQPGTSPAP